MIRYALRCAGGHDFESWFQSSGAYEALKASGHLACAVCGRREVEKAVMAPALGGRAREAEGPAPMPQAEAERIRLVMRRAAELAEAAARLRARVEAEAEHVGRAFAREARAIHAGEAPDRPIWGEATAAEARALIEDEIPVLPLPFGPRRAN